MIWEMLKTQVDGCVGFKKSKADLLDTYGIFETKPIEGDKVLYALFVVGGVPKDQVVPDIDLSLRLFLDRDIDMLEKEYELFEPEPRGKFPVLIKRKPNV